MPFGFYNLIHAGVRSAGQNHIRHQRKRRLKRYDCGHNGFYTVVAHHAGVWFVTFEASRETKLAPSAAQAHEKGSALIDGSLRDCTPKPPRQPVLPDQITSWIDR